VLLRDVPPDDPCGAAVLEAAAKVGMPTVAFNRGETVRTGAGWFQINAAEDGTRMSSSHAYLHPILGTRKNLEVRTNSWVAEILFDESLNATGVRYQRPDLTGHDVVSARREVVVTAGAIDTPKLLMLSGIGPAGHLREFGIDVLVDSPGVGSNLDDHVEGLVFWEASRPMVTTSTQWWEIGLFTTVDEDVTQPDLMMHYGSVPFDMNTLRRGYPTTDNGFCLTPNVTQGHSRGTVRLRSRDFRDRPRVDPRYFTDPDGYDERIMLTGVRLARKIAEQAPLADWVGRELAPGPDATTDDELLDYIHKCHNTVYHPAATARMGAVTDPMSVLDPELWVKGVSRLRVVDASAMPKLPSVNPNITVMTMAEKCADLIRKT
jgi:choline dehydrogenase-like flavoprotein